MTPRFYLDTNIIRDDVKSREIASIRWIQQIKERRWGCFTSMLAFMEMIDNEQEEAFVAKKRSEKLEYNTICRQRNQIELAKEQLDLVADEFRAVRGEYPFIRTVVLTREGWSLALRISEASNIFAPDAIHLASACQCESNILLTRDEHFRNRGNDVLKSENLGAGMKICNPDNAKKALADMGFEV